MTVTEYAAKYGVTDRAVYHAVYDGRLPKSYNGAFLDIPDVPFPDNGKMRKRAELYDLPDYILMHSLLSPDLGSGTNAAFWDRFDAHICTTPEPYKVSEIIPVEE